MSARLDLSTAPREALELLQRWVADAREARLPEPASVAFVTVGEGGRPTARTVSLKRVEPDALLFTSALWTRKARELQGNPHVALLFHWPSLARQVQVAGEATLAERVLAEELFAERELAHQLQTLVSRQGEPIDDLQPLRDSHAHLTETTEAPPVCPSDWGALRVRPSAVEFWLGAEDRIHDRLLYVRESEDWSRTRLSP